MTLELALSLSARLAAAAVLLSTAELLAVRAPLRDEGLMSWEVGRLRMPGLVVGPVAKLLHVLLRYPTIVFLLVLRLGFSASLIIGPEVWTRNPIPLLSLFVLAILMDVRSLYGHDGADQLSRIVMLALGISALFPTPLTLAASALFLAFQACLAYGTAGWAKAGVPGWQDGSYLASIMSTRMYGTPWLGEIFRARPRVAMASSRFVVGWECLFPLVVVLPAPAGYAFLAIGIAFHAGNALLMGLNAFFWSFIATYPAVLWLLTIRGW